MKNEDLLHLVEEIAKTRKLDSLIIVGSLSVLGIVTDREVPDTMLISNEVDAYPENDPRAAFDIAEAFGQGSIFEQENGYYFDAISPDVPTLPEGWQQRLIVRQLDNGVRLKFIDPNDAAISKYARGEPKDLQWIDEGLRASVLAMATIRYRFRETTFLDDDERERVRAQINADAKRLGYPAA